MPAGAGDHSFQAPGGQRLGRDVIRAGAVEHDHRFQFFPVRLDQLAHSAQIPFPLFSHVSHKQKGAPGFDVSKFERSRNGDKCRNAGAIIGNARRRHAVAVPMNFHVRASRENRIKMCGKHHNFIFGCTAQLPNDVADLIDARWEAAFREQFAHGTGARFFLKGRRGNLR